MPLNRRQWVAKPVKARHDVVRDGVIVMRHNQRGLTVGIDWAKRLAKVRLDAGAVVMVALADLDLVDE